MSYYGYTCRHNSMAKTILQGKFEGARIRGRPKKDWMSNITMWTKTNSIVNIFIIKKIHFYLIHL